MCIYVHKLLQIYNWINKFQIKWVNYCCYSTVIKKNVLVHHWFLHIMLGSFDFVFINISKQSRIHGKYSMYSVFSFGRAFITWWNIMWWYFSEFKISSIFTPLNEMCPQIMMKPLPCFTNDLHTLTGLPLHWPPPYTSITICTKNPSCIDHCIRPLLVIFSWVLV